MALSLAEFVSRWKIASLSERAGAQSHFLDLCDLLGEPHPAASDPVGERFTFEKAVSRTDGGYGFADVWLRDHFAWEYKESRSKKHRDLRAAYKQLNDYREDLLNPPLLVVCDMNRFEVHTNFGKSKKRVYSFDLDDLGRNQITANCPLPPLDVLRALFHETGKLRPEATDAFVTQEAARTFSRLAERLEIEKRALTDAPIATRQEIAHFLMRLLFCLFADNIGLLPGHAFRRLIQSDDRFSPRTFLRKLRGLFAAMSEPEGIWGEHTILYFNGGLFDTSDVLEMDLADLAILYEVSTRYNWAHVAPAIFGTLFERSLMKERRSLIGAHYTGEADIELIVEPVVMEPLRARWQAVRASVLTALERSRTGTGRTLLTSHPEAERLLAAWFDELAAVRVLDPACGSGNFLYVALRKLLDLWAEAREFALVENIQLAMSYAVEKMVSPQQLFGIETEFYAHELASIVVWIGFLQWKHEHGIRSDRQPLLQKLSNIEHDDAILRYDAEGRPYEPQWPRADFIIGNPPFLGGKRLRGELGDVYVDDLFEIWRGRVKAESDLVVYWFEKARAIVSLDGARRVGLLATQAIRGGANRNVLSRILESGNIFWAWSDRPWLLDGAAVHVSMVAFDRGDEKLHLLNGEHVSQIFSNLTADLDVTQAHRLEENFGLCFMGTSRAGNFDIAPDLAKTMLAAPMNPNGRPNSDVLKPWLNTADITGRRRGMFAIDFDGAQTERQAALYELPFEYLRLHVYPTRSRNRRQLYADRWWLHAESRPAFRAQVKDLRRFILTTRVSIHRLFIWVEKGTLPDSATFAFARDDDYFFGVLHSKVHELWSRAQGTQLREVQSGFRYTPRSTFDTFPFPWPPGAEPSEADSPQVRAIADAARELVTLRDRWLHPLDAAGQPVPEAELKDRTLTKLYNLRAAGKCAWLEDVHRRLDAAVFAAYGWPANLPTQEILARLLALNHRRAVQPATA